MLFWLCWFIYFVTYLGRLNYSSAMPEIIGEGILTRSSAGLISTLFFTCYAIGQLVNGFLGDKVSPKVMIFIGVLLSGISNLFMAISINTIIMDISWAVNGYAQAMVWPPIVRIFSDMLPKKTVIKCLTNLASTIALGTLASYLISAAMISLSGWKGAFILPSIILVTAAIIWVVAFSKIQLHCNLHGEFEHSDVSTVKSSGPKPPFFALLINPAVLIILIPLIAHGVLKDGVTAWVPTYISETFNTSAVSSILATTLLPVVNVLGAYAAQLVRKSFRGSEIKTACLFFGVALVSLLSLYLFSGVSIILTVSLLSLITSSMLAVNTTFISFVPLHFAKISRASTMSGFFNSVSYIGAAISSVSIGILVSTSGWGVTIASFCAITLTAVILCFLGRKRVF